MAGLRAVAGSPLPVFGAPFGPGYSQCAAVAEAMRRCGFKQCATPAAVAKLARRWHQRLREMRPVLEALAQFVARAEETKRLADAMARVGAHLARIAKADFTNKINGLGLYENRVAKVQPGAGRVVARLRQSKPNRMVRHAIPELPATS
jgi:hypothetical protein